MNRNRVDRTRSWFVLGAFLFSSSGKYEGTKQIISNFFRSYKPQQRQVKACNDGSRLDSARDEEAGQGDRNQIFADRHEKIFDMQIVYDAPSEFVTDERSDHTADSTQERAGK